MLSPNRSQRCYFFWFMSGHCTLIPISEKFEGYTFLTGANPSLGDPNNIPMLRNATGAAARTQHRKNWKEKGGRGSLSFFDGNFIVKNTKPIPTCPGMP